MGWTTDELVFDSQQGQEMFLIPNIQTSSGAHPASYTTDILGVKRQGHETDHSPLSSAKVKNGGAILPLPHTSSWHGAYLIKPRDNFTFILLKRNHKQFSKILLHN
jgi:hypothetical protein